MTLPDVNVLVYASRREAPNHRRYAAWLTDAVAGSELALVETAQHAEIAERDPQVRGPLMPDAWLAAVAVSHGCRPATADRDFTRFDGLDWFVPVE